MPSVFTSFNPFTPHNITQTQTHKTIDQSSPCSSPPPSSLSPPALPSSLPRQTQPYAAAELLNAARPTSLTLLPSPARTVSFVFCPKYVGIANNNSSHWCSPDHRRVRRRLRRPWCHCSVLCAAYRKSYDSLPFVCTNANSFAAWPGSPLRFPVEKRSTYLSIV